jgi:predicted dehydrogenase
MAPAVHAAEGAVLQRVAARDLARAEALSPEAATTSYDDVIAADDVDAVYISLTNEVHERWVIAALGRGKHVLCEKPLAMSAESVGRMAAAAQRAQLVEALWYRWHPRYRRTLDLIDSGAIGDVQRVQAHFSFSGVPRDNYRLRPAQGGGALLDVGPYTVDAALSVVAAATGQEAPEVEVVSRRRVMGDLGGAGEVDLTTQVELVVDGVAVLVTVSIDGPEEQSFSVQGSKGSLQWPSGQVFTVWREPCRLEWHSDGVASTESFDAIDPYVLMVEQCGRAMAGDEPSLMPLAHSARLARVLDTLSASA